MINANIHATTVAYDNKGILLIGASGSGKSDLALRLICEQNAVLVADDRTDIVEVNGVLKASCPQNIKGLLEVRGIGVCKFDFCPEVEIKLAVETVGSYTEVERMPDSPTKTIGGCQIPLLKIYPFEPSAVAKILTMLRQIK